MVIFRDKPPDITAGIDTAPAPADAQKSLDFFANEFP